MAPEEVVEETAEELVVAAMVLAAVVEVVAAYQVDVPLDKAHTLVLDLRSSSKEPSSIRICSWRQSC